MDNAIVIKESKFKAFLLLLGSLGFIGMAIFYLIYAGPFEDFAVYVIYGIGIVFFGFCGWIASMKFFRGRSGVEVNGKGITFYSYNLERNSISWGEIENIEEYSIVDQKFVNVYIKFPEFYIEKQGSGFNRGLMKLNNDLAGSPIQLSASTLDITHEELLDLLREGFRKSRSDTEVFL